MVARRRCAAGLLLALQVAAGPVSAQDAGGFLSLSSEAGRLEIGRTDLMAVETSESGGITDIFLRLMPSASGALADLTARSVGQEMRLELCGAILIRAVVRDEIDSGTLYVAGTSAVRAEALRALWHGRRTCDTLAPEVFEHGQ